MNIFITTFFKSILIWLLPSIPYIYMWFAALFSGRIDEHSAKWGKMVETISKKISYIVPFQLFETTQKCIQKYWLEWSFFSQCSSQQFNPFKTCWAFLKLLRCFWNNKESLQWVFRRALWLCNNNFAKCKFQHKYWFDLFIF